jgi:cell wall-associated NlpC family hydrolase
MNEERTPQAGDVIWVDRGFYNHCGIYAGGGRVIHFAPLGGGFELDPDQAIIHETTFRHFADGGQVKVIDFPEGYSPEETVRRARSCIGKRGPEDTGYDLAANNCDHFATWCKTGEFKSLQVEDVKAVARVLGGTTGEIICAIQEVAQSFNAPQLTDTKKAEDVAAKIEANTELSDTMPAPLPETEAETPEVEIVSDEEAREIEKRTKRFAPDAGPEEPFAPTGDAVPYIPDDSQDGGNAVAVAAPPPKQGIIDRIATKLKGVTVAVAGGLEICKKKLPAPLQKLDYKSLGAKVANGIDKVATFLKVATGRITPQQAHEECVKADTALYGAEVARAHDKPIRQVMLQVAGKVGAVVKHVAQKAVEHFVPAPVRAAVAVGTKALGNAVATGVRKVVEVAKKVGTAVVGGLKTAGKAVVGLFKGLFGR